MIVSCLVCKTFCFYFWKIGDGGNQGKTYTIAVEWTEGCIKEFIDAFIVHKVLPDWIQKIKPLLSLM